MTDGHDEAGVAFVRDFERMFFWVVWIFLKKLEIIIYESNNRSIRRTFWSFDFIFFFSLTKLILLAWVYLSCTLNLELHFAKMITKTKLLQLNQNHFRARNKTGQKFIRFFTFIISHVCKFSSPRLIEISYFDSIYNIHISREKTQRNFNQS